MQTRSSRQHRTNSEKSDRPAARLQTRPWSDPLYEQPEQSQSPHQGYDLSNIDLFSHDPGPRAYPQVNLGAQSPVVQAKLTVGAPNDQYEQEADRVAEQVMSTPDSPPPPIQRESASEEEELQAKPLASAITPLVQREMAPEEGEAAIQTKGVADAAFSVGSHSAASTLESQLSRSQGGGSPLPEEVRTFMEPRFGADFSQVRVHTGNEAVQMNQGLGAQAFAHGQDVYFGSGKSPAKDDLTAHELTHVVQQGGAPVVQGRPAQPIAADSKAEVQLRSQVPSIQRALNWTRNDLETGAGTKTFRSTEYKNIVRILHNYNAITNPSFDRVAGLQELIDACLAWTEKNRKETSTKVNARRQVIQRLVRDATQEITLLQGNGPVNPVPGPTNQAVPVNANGSSGFLVKTV